MHFSLMLFTAFGGSFLAFASKPFPFRFDKIKAASNSNYPTCQNLPVLFKQLDEEEQRRYNMEQNYQTWLESGLLNCGKWRVGWGIFGKRHNELWKEGCITEILPAKRRLLNLMQDLCNTQDEANKIPKSANNISTLSRRTPTRGIIYTGKGEHFKDIFQSIIGLRLLNITLPAEIWINARDEYVCKTIFESTTVDLHRSPSTSAPSISGIGLCKTLPDFVSGFASKFYSLLYTKLNHVLFIDADNIVSRDVNTIFDSPEFKQYGAVIWPDLWGEACRTVPGLMNGETGFQSHVLWMARFGGLEWTDERDNAQESEAGQIAYDLERHAGLLELCRRFIEDLQFLNRVVNGDKDIFRLVHLIMGEPFYYVKHLPGYSVADKPGYGRDCLTHYFNDRDETLTNTPMFFHQLKARDPDAFMMAKRIDPSLRNDPSGCVDLSVRPGYKPLVIEKHNHGDTLRANAKQLFDIVDHEWKGQGLESLLWYHEWELFFIKHNFLVNGATLVIFILIGFLRYHEYFCGTTKKLNK